MVVTGNFIGIFVGPSQHVEGIDVFVNRDKWEPCK